MKRSYGGQQQTCAELDMDTYVNTGVRLSMPLGLYWMGVYNEEKGVTDQSLAYLLRRAAWAAPPGTSLGVAA